MNATNVAKWRRYDASFCVISKVYTLGGVKYQLRLTKYFRAICEKIRADLPQTPLYRVLQQVRLLWRGAQRI